MSLPQAPRDRASYDEAAAIRIALTGRTRDRARVAARAIAALHRDPNQTEHVFSLGIALNAGQLPRVLSEMAVDPMGSKLLREQPAIDRDHVDFAFLRTLPAHTLGGAYVRMVDELGLDPDMFQPPPGLPEIPAYVTQRIRQTHDLWHLLTGYGTDVAGEVVLQAFTYGQLRVPSSIVIALVGGVRIVPRAPGIVRAAFDGYRRGRQARFLAAVRFEDMWERDLDEVRTSLQIRPARVTPPTLFVDAA
ncbi:MAG: Coq4 family protein [Sandaracinaceae bacterium]